MEQWQRPRIGKRRDPFSQLSWTTKRNLLINFVSVFTLFLLFLLFQPRSPQSNFSPSSSPTLQGTQPLVMKGGDPYIRALMRTITASEANDPKPYHILYGGSHVSDLSSHPEKCMPILAGPNVGNCSTAAGRYQFINTTWYDQAQRYHPNPSGMLWWKNFSFEPEYQDIVVHEWLSDRNAWGMDLSQRLQQGEIEEVLKRLSSIWTSLGYGIETNSMSRHLPNIYQKMLQEELGVQSNINHR